MVCLLACLLVYVFLSISSLLQHAPLHYAILPARFVLVQGYMIIYNVGFQFLDVLAFTLRPFHFSFSKSLELANIVNCFRYFFTNSHFRTGQSSSLGV